MVVFGTDPSETSARVELPAKTVGRGTTAEGDTWTLTVEGTAERLRTMVQITRYDGTRPWGGGMGGGTLRPGNRLDLGTGCSDAGPQYLVMRLAEDVAAVVATLSDGTREDVQLFTDDRVPGLRVAALVFPRDLDLHRLVLLDARGQELEDRTEDAASQADDDL